MTVQPPRDGRDCDLLAAVSPPPGVVSAGPWEIDTSGHLVRTLADGRVQQGNGTVTGQRRHCTVPTDGADTCGFCASYSPPESVAQRLDAAVNRVDLLRHDLNEELQGLPAEAPLFAVVDLVTVLGHLRQAAVLLDKATDALEAASTEAVQR